MSKFSVALAFVGMPLKTSPKAKPVECFLARAMQVLTAREILLQEEACVMSSLGMLYAH